MRRYAIALAAGFLGTTAVPGVAAAASAVVTEDLNMRAGPSTEFPVVDVIPDNGRVTVHGCVRGYSWCDVTWRDARGWVFAEYLRYFYASRYVPLIEYAPRAGVPITTFSVEVYWHDHYRRRPWYGRRAYWREVWRDRRRAIREERREDRADRRRDRREDRAERRRERRETTQERRRERREAIRERRRERSAEVRQERRERRLERQRDGDARIDRRDRPSRGGDRGERPGRGREG